MRSNQISYRFACVLLMPEKYLQFILIDSNTNSENETSMDVVNNEKRLEKNELEDDNE